MRGFHFSHVEAITDDKKKKTETLDVFHLGACVYVFNSVYNVIIHCYTESDFFLLRFSLKYSVLKQQCTTMIKYQNKILKLVLINTHRAFCLWLSPHALKTLAYVPVPLKNISPRVITHN